HCFSSQPFIYFIFQGSCKILPTRSRKLSSEESFPILPYIPLSNKINDISLSHDSKYPFPSFTIFCNEQHFNPIFFANFIFEYFLSLIQRCVFTNKSVRIIFLVSEDFL